MSKESSNSLRCNSPADGDGAKEARAAPSRSGSVSPDHKRSDTSSGTKDSKSLQTSQRLSHFAIEPTELRRQAWESLLEQRPRTTESAAISQWILKVLHISDLDIPLGSSQDGAANHHPMPSDPSNEPPEADEQAKVQASASSSC